MIPLLYKDGGLQMNTGMDMFILQGTCVGGSTTLSNMVHDAGSEDVLSSWSAVRRGARFARASRAPTRPSSASIGATEADAAHTSGSTQALHRGRAFARVLAAADAQGSRGLPRMRQLQHRVRVRREAKRTRDVRPVGGEARRPRPRGDRGRSDRDAGRRAVAVHVRAGRSREPQRIVAKQVVVAAGAINSSALLLKSGLRKNVGTRVSFNAGSMMVAEFDEPLDGYDADQMTWFLPGDGFIIEPTHNPLMSAALTTPGWLEEHATLMRRQRHLAYAGSLISTGADGQGRAESLLGSRGDTLPSGARRSGQGPARAQADLARSSSRRARAASSCRPTAFAPSGRRRRSREIDEHVVSTRRFSFGSAHPQGGNPMSENSRAGVVDANFAVHGSTTSSSATRASSRARSR